jgi:small subunit ribosomal protein S16
VAVKIKLKRLGKMRAPQYRIVVADARTKRDGRAIEEIGHYHPKEHPSFIEVDRPRVQYWLGVGAQPTEAVMAILKVTGDWQTFKGLPGSEGTLQTAAPKVDKRAVFEAAAKESADEPKAEAITPRVKRAKAEDKPAEPVAAEAPEAEAAPEAPAEAVAEAAPEAPAEAAPEAPAEAVAEAAPEAPAEAAPEAPAEAVAEAAPEAPAEASPEAAPEAEAVVAAEAAELEQA